MRHYRNRTTRRQRYRSAPYKAKAARNEIHILHHRWVIGPREQRRYQAAYAQAQEAFGQIAALQRQVRELLPGEGKPDEPVIH